MGSLNRIVMQKTSRTDDPGFPLAARTMGRKA